jgi:hypothetical protein
MNYLKLNVRPSWLSEPQEYSPALKRTWWGIQWIVFAAICVNILVGVFHFPSPWSEILRILFSFVLLWLAALGMILEKERWTSRSMLLFSLICAGLTILAWMKLPFSLPIQPNLTYLLASCFLLVNLYATLRFLWTTYPQFLSKWGVTRHINLPDLGLGLVVGLSVCLHFQIIEKSIIGLNILPTKPPLLLLGNFFFITALVVPAVEFFMRGVVFSLLTYKLYFPFWKTLLYIVLFEVLLSLTLLIADLNTLRGLLIVLYSLMASILATILRKRSGSIWPGFVAQIPMIWIFLSSS